MPRGLTRTGEPELFGGHTRFDVGQHPLLAHQRHHGVGNAKGTDPYR
ncbi:hypothetical protein [Aeromonas sanarellii]